MQRPLIAFEGSEAYVPEVVKVGGNNYGAAHLVLAANSLTRSPSFARTLFLSGLGEEDAKVGP